MPVNSAIYNPFAGTGGQVGGIYTNRQAEDPSAAYRNNEASLARQAGMAPPDWTRSQYMGYTGTSPYGQSLVGHGGTGNIFGDVARDATQTPTGNGATLGYGPDGDTPEYKDNAWSRFLATMSPFLNANQVAYLNSQRGLYNDATAQAQARDPGYHFADVLGNADVTRQLEQASPFQVGGSARYVPTRFR